MSKRIAMVMVGFLVGSPGVALSVDVGPPVFRECKVCHSVLENGPTRVGPTLYGVLGRKVAGVVGFSYSSVMKKQDFVWDRKSMDRFIKNPKEMIPGTYMAFAGMGDPQQRAEIIDFLNKLSPNHQPPP